MTTCNGCGDCCRALGMPVSQRKVRLGYYAPRFKEWVTEELEQITFEEACEILPNLRHQPNDRYWYTCKNFDAEDNSCRIHGDYGPAGGKTYACAEFPAYGKEPTWTNLWTYQKCSFVADIPQRGLIPLPR